MSFAGNIDDIVAENHSKLLGTHPSWARVRLREVATVLNGFAFESSRFSKSEGTPLIRIRDIVPGQTETFYLGEVDKAYLVKRGEILVGMDGDFNCAEWPGEPALLNQRVCKITPNEEFYSRRFLLHVLPAYLAAINEHTSSITVKHLSSRTVGDIPLPLPPRLEQERIVAKLDSLLSRVAAGEAASRRALDRLQHYRAAVLRTAVTGELTAGWRKTHKPKETGAQLVERLLKERRARWEETERNRLDSEGKPAKDNKWKKRYPEPLSPKPMEGSLPKSWCWASLDELSTVFVDSAHRTPKYSSSGIPAIGPRDVVGGVLDLHNARKVTKSEFAIQTKRRIPQAGDIVYSRELSFGWGAVVEIGQDLCLSQGMCLFRPHSDIDLRFFLSLLNGPWGREQAQRAATGTAHPHVNLTDIKGFVFPVPPVEEQLQLRREIERRVGAADKLAATLNRQLDLAVVARRSLLNTAFAGELVPQDPKDEPASALLERISAGREAEAKKPKGKRMPKPKLKSVETLDQLERLIDNLGRGATPERLLLAAGLGDDVEKFFDLLRVGRDKGSLIVPVGKSTVIRRVQHAN